MLLNKYNFVTSLKQHSDSSHNKKVQKDIEDALLGVYGNNFKRAVIESCDPKNDKIECDILLMFGSTEYPDRLNTNQTCFSSDDTELCLIPPKVVVEKKILEKVAFKEVTEVCSHKSFCTSPKVCEMNNEKFHCKCPKEYFTVESKDYADIGVDDICNGEYYLNCFVPMNLKFIQDPANIILE
ncbi:uncharacterized protein LOC111083658 [Limulus polyphemus]|uniref:Uncharacterized protein LOC111083658 n=1 Tax=Limulus polyphemus TaxID=6850 RepID=A0ABM1RXA5_LIMPO|nr:uncharacterized protein LOC111083658 [Limulus polyphemus]